jgi:hypothetical protein
MLLTFTTTHRPATGLGFLLRKNPARVQRFTRPFGEAPTLDAPRPTAVFSLGETADDPPHSRRGI